MLGILVILSVAVVSVYAFIPQTLVVATVTPINTNYTNAVAYSSDSNNWAKWWPTITKNDSKQVGMYKGVGYQIVYKSYNNTQLKLVYKNDTTIANMAVAGFIHDSVKIICQFTFEANLNPITRIKQYNTAVYLKQNVHDVMDGKRISGNDASNMKQELDMRHANFTTAFNYGDKADVSYTYYSLRQLPFLKAVVKLA